MSLEIQGFAQNDASEESFRSNNDGNDGSCDDDSTNSSSSSYVDPSTNDLTTITGAALIVADCMGTGILALPNNINVTLGRSFGLFFLILNVFINLYAGTILCNVALIVEKRFCGLYTSINDGYGGQEEDEVGEATKIVTRSDDSSDGVSESIGVMGGIGRGTRAGDDSEGVDWSYDNADDSGDDDDNNNDDRILGNSDHIKNYDDEEEHQNRHEQKERYQTSASTSPIILKDHDDGDEDDYENMQQLKKPISKNSSLEHHDDHDHHHNHGAHTFDFIGMTTALFNQPDDQGKQEQQLENEKPTVSKATIIVTITYYTNIFLVLGNYILVMSHAVAAMLGEQNICLPSAGLIASTLMFGLCQLRSMSSLGHCVSFVSLLALAIVVIQCLASIQSGHDAFMYEDSGGSGGGERRFLQEQQEQQQIADAEDGNTPLFTDQGVSYNLAMFQAVARQFAALSSIGFAVGSQKLLLNIRHEYKDRTQAAPQSLGIALLTFGTVYALVCILSGPKPPSFLFDAISPGLGRRVAGFLLWIHVAVSFAINSQALCSSIDRIKFHRITLFSLHKHHRLRWAILTFVVSISSFLIANAIPFFKDLVSLIGALTSVPLTLLLPAIYIRKIREIPLFCWSMSASLRQREDIFSFLLVIFSGVFLICGVVGSISSIEIDWSHHGPPFACH